MWVLVWQKSAVMRIVDYDILVSTYHLLPLVLLTNIAILAITSASLIVFGTSLFGICGTLLNSRPLLAIYCVLLWPSFAAMLVIGYTAYRRAAFALPSKIDQAWSQKYGDEDRMILQYSVSPHMRTLDTRLMIQPSSGAVDTGPLNTLHRPLPCAFLARRSQGANRVCFALNARV